MTDLKDFQEDAVSQLVDVIRAQISAINAGAKIDPNIIFKSPTGSGKTLMMTETLCRLPEDLFFSDKYFVFLWLAPVKLHSQSYTKLKKELHDDVYTLINIDDGLANESLAPNTILFSNWEKVYNTAKNDIPEKGVKAGDWTNTVVRQGEQANLQDILSATREKGGKIILIVDECHQAFYSGEKAQRFANEVVKPSLIIQMSATPKEKATIETKYEDVVESGLIKQKIIINNDLVSAQDTNETVMNNLISEALKKRDNLADKYKEMGKNINPLLLIQLPNDKETVSDLDLTYRDKIEKKLLEEGIGYEYGSAAVWLSDEKKNLDHIEDLDSPVKVLIFKQAIALGWDCPRAQVLLMLRDIKSDSFKIQTIGRVLRMPEAKHYLDDELNTAYVYTDLDSIKIEADEKDPMRNLIKYKKSRINPLFNSGLITLPDSIYLSRVDYGDLKASFRFILEDVLAQAFDLSDNNSKEECYKKINEKLEVSDEELAVPILSDEILTDIDTIISTEFNEDGIVKLKMDDVMIENVFNLILRTYIEPFKNFARSRSILYTALRNIFGKAGLDDYSFQKIFACSKTNQKVLKELFEIAIDRYNVINQQELKERRDREGKIFDFNIPETDEFSDNSTEIFTLRNIYTNYFQKNSAPKTTEKKFEEYIDHNDKILWWYKNGDKGEKYFAIPYYELDEKARSHRAAFYPDYIIRFKDGTTGIFDTKSGFTAEDKYAAQKADALQKYLRDHADLSLWGGFVIPGRNEGWQIQADYLNNQIIKGGRENLPEFGYSEDDWVDLSF